MSWLTRFWSWLRARLRRGRRAISAEARETQAELTAAGERVGETLAAAGSRVGTELREAGERVGSELREAGERLLDLVDDLPLIGRLLPFDPVRNQFYGHGAFMGAAPALLADPAWRRILAFLMPDVLEDVRAAVADGAGPGRVIPMFENNPVLCAFGAWVGIQRRRAALVSTHANDLAGMEWDVYMDGALVDAWEAAGDDRAARVRVREALVSSMVIAHASTADVVQEAAGVDQYADVRTTRKTGLGGVEVDAWLDLFGRALALAGADDLDAALAEMRHEERVLDGPECVRYTFVRPWEPSRVVDLWRRASGQPHLAIVLEVKSLRSTAPLVADIVASLNARGLLVRAVCAFKPEEVRGVSAVSQRVGGEVLPGPREMRFFHFAADLQQACDRGDVSAGHGVLFNGASLLVRGDDPPYRVDDAVVDDLERYRRKYGFDVGFYVQENDCDAFAAGVLSQLVAARPHTFELGFAWGGLYDEAAIEHDGEDRRGYGAQGMLTWISRKWRLPDTDA
jgi:hypothetical protein